MDKSNLQKIIEFSQAHIDKTLYSYLFMLFKYIFLGEEGISDKTNKHKILSNLKSMTNRINQLLIKKEERYIKLEPFNEVYTLRNFQNIFDFIKSQNSMFAGDIIEGIFIIIFSYGFESSKTNDFGKYIYINISKLRDQSNPDLIEWFKKAQNVFRHNEIKDIKKLLDNDPYINDSENNLYQREQVSLFYKLLLEILRLKFKSINSNIQRNKESRTFEFINNGEIELIQGFLYKFREMKNNFYNPSMVDKDFVSNSICFIYYYLFEEPKLPPIKIIRCFLTSIFIYYQNKNSPLMKYIEPYQKKNDDEEDLEIIPFNYSLKGAFVEGRFSNIIISPVKLEPRISNINFGQNNIREWGLFEVGKAITMNINIKTITLKIALLRGYYLDFFIAGLSIFDNYSIEELNLSMNYLREESTNSLMRLISHFKGLKTLNFSANELKGGLKYIFIYLKKEFSKGKCKLENLYLNNCCLDDSSYYELGELLKSKFCTLKRLSIGTNNRPNLVNFYKKLKKNKNLVELNIFKCGLRDQDTEDICRIISNTNIKYLNLFKNDFNIFPKCLEIIFRTRLIKAKDEFDDEYIIDRCSSLMSLDLSNNLFCALNSEYINLINKLIKDNSTISCLDLSHIFYGPYPDRSKSKKSLGYKNSLEKTLADTIKARKENFADLTFKKYQKELSVKNYEDKNDNEKLKNKNKRLDEKIEEVLQDENAKYILYLKEKCSDFIEKIKKGEKEYKNLIKYEGNSISGLEAEKIDIIEQQLLDYMVYKRDKEKLDEYNLKLGEKNLVLI